MKVQHQFRIELLITPLFITLGYLAIKYIGFSGIKESIFTLIVLLEIPCAYIGFKWVRKLFYSLISGYGDYED